MINTTKNTAAEEEAAIITTVGNELLLSSMITMIGMKTVVGRSWIRCACIFIFLMTLIMIYQEIRIPILNSAPE